ncbi:hypothetical protein ACFB49_26960 [Sphingomonas sp. DBB INV C78]
MITISDLNHHLRREKEERALADAATDPAARCSHLELAESHARRAARAKAYLERETQSQGSRPQLAT